MEIPEPPKEENISIHSPRVRGDEEIRQGQIQQIYFYPLPSGEGRQHKSPKKSLDLWRIYTTI